MGGLEVNHASLLEGDAVADNIPVTTCLTPNRVEEPRIWKAVLRLLDKQEPRNRTSKLELPVTIGLGAPPGSVRGQPKNVSAVQDQRTCQPTRRRELEASW